MHLPSCDMLKLSDHLCHHVERGRALITAMNHFQFLFFFLSTISGNGGNIVDAYVSKNCLENHSSSFTVT